MPHIAVNPLCDKGSDGGTTMSLVCQGAELLLENHAFQLGDTRGQCVLAVGIVEKRRVGEARTDDFLVTGDDLVGVSAIDIGDGDKERF